MRKNNFVVGEYYHIYNRGVDKRNVFEDQNDLSRFWNSMDYFNQLSPIGSIYEFTRIKDKKSKDVKRPLVEFVAYCINPNHYHFLLTPLEDLGIEKFMQRLGNGYTKYFNTRYKRNGSLFQGRLKSKLVDSNEYLLHLSVYINKNEFGHPMSKLSRSSLGEYENKYKGICNTEIITGQFKQVDEYKKFTDESFEDILIRKEMIKELEW
jgi:putative transposase